MRTLEVTPDRVIDDLRELAALSSDARGAQRVAFTPVWESARRWLRSKAAELPVEVFEDAAHNLWIRHGGPGPALAVGSHIDSVPNGGWLDGALGVLAGLEVLRAAIAAGLSQPVVLVDFADEEGRFGHSLLGSSAMAGLLDLDALRSAGAAETLDLDTLGAAARSRPKLSAYLELHIEQGPVLEAAGVPVAAVSGTLGVRRKKLTFVGQPAHAGATPFAARHDPVLAASRFVLRARELAADRGGLATVGMFEARPGTLTAVAASVVATLDARHAEPEELASLELVLRHEARVCAEAEGCAVHTQELWSIDPVPFDSELLARAHAATGARHAPLVSGPLHDAASVARMGVPTAMMFVRSLGGISHSAIEDSSVEDLRRGIEAFAALAGELLGA
jgi:N-carbamoyl-L-amino-acid hydrolase